MTDDVTKFWDALRDKWPHPVLPLSKIHLHDQLELVQAINTILQIINKNGQQK
jgi:hypothetical protein